MSGKEGGPFHPEDNQFINRLEAKIELSNRIDWLADQGLGKSITAAYPSKAPYRGKTLVIGSILPLNHIHTRHLGIFKNGDAYIFEPLSGDSEDESSANKALHKQEYSPNDTPLEITIPKPKEDIERDISDVITTLRFDTKVTRINISDTSKLKDLYARGIRVAKEANEKRDRMRDRNTESFLDMMRESFGDPGLPPADPPLNPDLPPPVK